MCRSGVLARIRRLILQKFFQDSLDTMSYYDYGLLVPPGKVSTLLSVQLIIG